MTFLQLNDFFFFFFLIQSFCAGIISYESSEGNQLELSSPNCYFVNLAIPAAIAKEKKFTQLTPIFLIPLI